VGHRGQEEWPIGKEWKRGRGVPTGGAVGSVSPIKATTNRHKAWKGNYSRADGPEHHKYKVARNKNYGQRTAMPYKKILCSVLTLLYLPKAS
jgi:hypothetical protein